MLGQTDLGSLELNPPQQAEGGAKEPDGGRDWNYRTGKGGAISTRLCGDSMRAGNGKLLLLWSLDRAHRTIYWPRFRPMALREVQIIPLKVGSYLETSWKSRFGHSLGW